MLTLFIKQILKSKQHPVYLISEIFKKHFYNVYKKFIVATLDKTGQKDTKLLMKNYADRTKELKTEFISASIIKAGSDISVYEEAKDEENQTQDGVNEVNLTN